MVTEEITVVTDDIDINYFKYFRQYAEEGITSWRFLNAVLIGLLCFIPAIGICVEVMHHIYHTAIFSVIAFQLGLSSPILLAFVMISMMIVGVLLHAVYKSLERYHILEKFFSDENELNFDKIRLALIITIYEQYSISLPKGYDKPLNSSEHHVANYSWYGHIITILALSLHVVIGDLALAANLGGLIQVNLFSFTAVLGPVSPILILLAIIILNLGIALWIHGAVDFESEHHNEKEKKEKGEIEAKCRALLADIAKIKEVCEMLEILHNFIDKETQEQLATLRSDYQNKRRFLGALKEADLISSEESTQEIREYDPEVIYDYYDHGQFFKKIPADNPEESMSDLNLLYDLFRAKYISPVTPEFENDNNNMRASV